MDNDTFFPMSQDLPDAETPLLGAVQAGFPSEAFNYAEEGIDFNRLLAQRKETTFCLWAGGDSMRGDGIFKGDLLVVDKLAEPRDNSIIVVSVDGEFTLKRVRRVGDHLELVSSNPDMPPIKVNAGEQVQRWGVLKFVIKKF